VINDSNTDCCRKIDNSQTTGKVEDGTMSQKDPWDAAVGKAVVFGCCGAG